VINNFDWVLRIDKIGLQLQFFYINHLFWNTEAFSELRDMENIMNCGYLGRKFQAICYRPTLLNDRKRPNIARGALSLPAESLDSFHWRYPQIDMVSHLECDGLTFLIRITFLSRLGYFQILLYESDLFFCLTDHLRAEHTSFSDF